MYAGRRFGLTRLRLVVTANVRMSAAATPALVAVCTIVRAILFAAVLAATAERARPCTYTVNDPISGATAARPTPSAAIVGAASGVGVGVCAAAGAARARKARPASSPE